MVTGMDDGDREDGNGREKGSGDGGLMTVEVDRVQAGYVSLAGAACQLTHQAIYYCLEQPEICMRSCIA